jgi:hypothetical protein
MADDDIAFLARFAYGNGVDPVDYATVNVIEGHLNVYLAVLAARVMNPASFPVYDAGLSTAVLSRRILGDLMDAGWTPPAVAEDPEP